MDKIYQTKIIDEAYGDPKEIIKEELDQLVEKYGDDRRSDITINESEINIEDIIPNENVVITISHLGYIKRTKTSEYRAQGRGGRGVRRFQGQVRVPQDQGGAQDRRIGEVGPRDHGGGRARGARAQATQV